MTIPEVEPVAYEIRFITNMGGLMPWQKVTLSEYEEMKDKPKWEVRKLFTSPPPPEGYFTRLAYEAVQRKFDKAEYDAEGNPLNLTAAAKDAMIMLEAWGATNVVVNLRKFIKD